MSSTLERLRRLHGLREQSSRTDIETAPSPERSAESGSQAVDYFDCARNGQGASTRLEELIPGVEIENSGGVCYMTTQIVPLTQPRGPQPMQALLAHSPALLHRFHPQFNLHDDTDFRRAAFIDTETTGLGAGAGVYCFMVGIGTFEHISTDDGQPHAATLNTQYSTLNTSPTHFVVRQLFMRSPAEECALLVALTELLDGCEMTVTFNGRTFDLPLLRARFRQNGRVLPPTARQVPLLQAEQPHLDLLHPARLLGRRRLESCRLIHLEQAVLQMQRSGNDVPSHLIPALYTEYARSGNAHAMPGIFYHNGEDILSMVGLAERLYGIFGLTDEDVHAAQTELHGLDWLALGCNYERLEDWPRAERAFQRALDALTNRGREKRGRIDAFRRLGQLQKKQERWDEAAATWQLWLSSVTDVDPTPYIELAKYCEWQTGDLEQAAMWTGWALHNLRTAPNASQAARQIAELEHRLARLERKQQTT